VNGNDRLTTSPMLFGHRAASGRLGVLDARTGVRGRLTDARGAELMLAFLEPRSLESAVSEGWSLDDIQEARAAGLLVAEEEYGRLAPWERSGWSRPAYLLFSQTNLEYAESPQGVRDLAEVTAERRSAVADYEQVEGYPVPGLLAAGRAIDLPPPTEHPPRLGGLTARQSVRAFSREPPRAAQLGDVLHAATQSHRLIAADRASGDPFRLLNSLYSWAHLFVVVQDVAGLPPGVFEYDWREHRLVTSAESPGEEELLACVQGQRWVLGAGFALFVVADLGGYAWLYRHSRAYVHVLIQLGELGQEILMTATELGLGGWTSPAVHESRTARALGLPDDPAVEALSVVKLGLPLRPPLPR
jgi:SagB-type dehydrogenase family enzyme